MTFVVTLLDVVPNPRFDNLPWTNARLQESTTADGPWSDIQVYGLVADVDPSSPRSRNFTTELATIQEGGWYRVEFYDEDGDESQFSDPRQNTPDPRDLYLPAVNDVAKFMRARTKDKNGTELGYWDGNTRPTYLQVDDLIKSAADEVLQKFPSVPAATYGAFKRVILIRTAMDIELGYYPEQVGTDRSPYSRYSDRYDSALTDLQTAWDRATAVADDSTDDPGGAGMPKFYYPPRRTIGPSTVM